ncbi:cbb3-type cytochrome c oxidase subunit II [Dyadobacter fanqingshengii]|uniref:Cytochrome c n=1 Tax=Dyadobacter fanqingshengii TaxID=2906443 RepID=A0A9X1P9T6_9BACT|nr:cbb3-type cytochrome c oxidase subunit II [Dyadobacter fanqingshengii]MCF0039713.1 cytochrome c [Dyadobacter fanqingshengii]USJ38524.1 cytochrome c [Dyadobacter fanqingshengii]
MDFFYNHTKLFGAAFLLFLVLTVFVALVPAINNEKKNAPLPGFEPLSDDAVEGKALFVANGCVACHTQQVRNVDMDRMWGQRPSVAADYAAIGRTDFWRNTATLMGTERTGPDLTSIGTRQPSKEWNLVHLFNPRIVVKESIMPAYPWLFEVKKEPSREDVIVIVPEIYLKEPGTLVARKDALKLVAYLQSLKQIELPGGATTAFLYKKETKPSAEEPNASVSMDGPALYATHCQACHQPTGEGLKGAFPALTGSPIVLNDNPEIMLNIVVNGYDAREEFGVMPAIGKNARLTPDEIAAIMNHERTSWGNNARKVTVQEIGKLMDAIRQLPVQ